MTKTGTLALGILMATTAGALAAGSVQRSADHAYEIEQGRKDGSITWREGIKLRKEQREIANLRMAYKADGYLSASERRVLRKKQNTAANHIDNESTDGWRRLWWLPRVGK
jgi:hypothetical protein